MPGSLDALLAILRRASLLSPSADTIRLHRLVQTVLRGIIPRDERERWVQTAVLVVSGCFLSEQTPRKQDWWQAWLPHGRAVMEHASAWRGAEFPILLYKLGVCLLGLGECDEAPARNWLLLARILFRWAEAFHQNKSLESMYPDACALLRVENSAVTQEIDG